MRDVDDILKPILNSVSFPERKKIHKVHASFNNVWYNWAILTHLQGKICWVESTQFNRTDSTDVSEVMSLSPSIVSRDSGKCNNPEVL